jgi:alpha-tubulin suppressor-like RCC1 family protein
VSSEEPVTVSDLANVTQVATGPNHACALTASGIVKCWGNNFSSQLGRDTNRVPSSTPIEVVGLSGVKRLIVAEGRSCALTESTVKCWGKLVKEEQGVLKSVPNPTPTEVPGLGAVQDVALGDESACARTLGNTVKCWGQGNYGQLGNAATNVYALVPVDVPGLADIQQIASGAAHVCALNKGGIVKCWGSNYSGQVSGTVDTAVTEPTDVGLTGIAQIVTGSAHSCALLQDSTVKCWGSNAFGQAGTVTAGDLKTPVLVPNVRGVAQLSAQAESTLFTLKNGQIRMSGRYRLYALTPAELLTSR